jgi:hypothetical protein
VIRRNGVADLDVEGRGEICPRAISDGAVGARPLDIVDGIVPDTLVMLINTVALPSILASESPRVAAACTLGFRRISSMLASSAWASE